VLFVVDHPGPEALLEEVALPAVPAVEPLRVQAVQAVHHRRQLLARSLDDEVVVRAHQAPREQADAEQPGGLLEKAEERLPVDVVCEDEDAAGSSRARVEEAVR